MITDEQLKEENGQQLFDIIKNNFYSSSKEPIEDMYKDMLNITERLEIYGDTHEKAVLNLCTYKSDLVSMFYAKVKKERAQGKRK